MYSLQKIYKSLLILFFGAFTLNSASALEIFYDAQLDAYIKDVSKDLVQNSNIKDLKVYLASSPDINAFATENNEIVFYSGLIEKADKLEQVQGVLAHELGHLMAQHHIKSRVKNQSTGLPSIAGTVLGMGAVVAGAPQAGMALIVGGSAAGASKYLKHSREHENEADAIALKLLADSNISAQGLASFFKVLERQEKMSFRANPEYLSTHPTTHRRKAFVQNNIIEYEDSESSKEDYDVFKAKLYALTNESSKTINYYALKNESLAKSLAYTIAYTNTGDFNKAYEFLDKSKSQGLDDKWYYDMLGQIHYQKNNMKESLSAYEKSAKAGNNSWILDFQIAESYLALKDEKAVDYYFNAIAKFKHFHYTYKRIADFYAQNSQMAKAHSYLAQYYSKLEHKEKSLEHVKLALEFYSKESLNDKKLKIKLEESKDYLEKKLKDNK